MKFNHSCYRELGTILFCKFCNFTVYLPSLSITDEVMQFWYRCCVQYLISISVRHGRSSSATGTCGLKNRWKFSNVKSFEEMLSLIVFYENKYFSVVSLMHHVELFLVDKLSKNKRNYFNFFLKYGKF